MNGHPFFGRSADLRGADARDGLQGGLLQAVRDRRVHQAELANNGYFLKLKLQTTIHFHPCFGSGSGSTSGNVDPDPASKKNVINSNYKNMIFILRHLDPLFPEVDRWIRKWIRGFGSTSK